MRIDQLTFPRFLAAIAIVIFHFGREVYPFNTDLFAPIFNRANLGVSFFFFLSGFVMILAYGNNEKILFSSYFRNRLARIYPLYFFSLLLTCAVFVFLDYPVGTFSFFNSVLLVQAWNPQIVMDLNYPGWSISVEFFFYLLFPFLFNRLFSKHSLGKTALVTILVWILSQLIINLILESSFLNLKDNRQLSNFVHYSPILHLNEFLLGIVGSLFFIKIKDSWGKKLDLLAVVFFLVTLIILYNGLPINSHNGALAIIFIPIIIILSLNTGYITKLFKNKVLVFLGEISFGVYILQVPIFLIVEIGLNWMGIYDKNYNFWIGLICLLISSIISFLVIEKPIGSLIRKRFNN